MSSRANSKRAAWRVRQERAWSLELPEAFAELAREAAGSAAAARSFAEEVRAAADRFGLQTWAWRTRRF